MKKIIIMAAAVAVLHSFVHAQQVIRLYEGKAPGSENWNWSEKESPKNGFGTRLVYNVVDPTLTAYLPPTALANGTAVIVAPGGAFHILSIENEGIAVAKWLNAHGIQFCKITHQRQQFFYRIIGFTFYQPVFQFHGHYPRL